MADFAHNDPFPLADDGTAFRHLTADFVSVGDFDGHQVLRVDPAALTYLAREAMRDVSFLLRPAHLEQVAAILQDPEAAVRLICDLAFGPETSPEMVRMGRRQMEAIPPEVIHGDFVACDAFNFMDRLGEITAPAFVLCGSQDHLTPSKYSIYLRDRIARAVLHLVEGAGHMVMVERPQVVVQALSSFLEGL